MVPTPVQTTICISGRDISVNGRHEFVLSGKVQLGGDCDTDPATSFKLSVLGDRLRRELVESRRVANEYQEDETQFQGDIVEDVGQTSGLTDDISVHYVSPLTMEGLKEEDGWQKMPEGMFADVSNGISVQPLWRQMQLARAKLRRAG